MRLIHFDSPAVVSDWFSIDDRVMGGLSRSRLRHDPGGRAIFEGTVSVENNGGFASVRSRPSSFGVARCTAYVLEALGDGRYYKLNLRTDDAFDGVNYQARFEAPAADWRRIRLAVADFVPTFRGRPVPGAPALDTRAVRQIGLMIAERQSGPFRLAVRTIEAE